MQALPRQIAAARRDMRRLGHTLAPTATATRSTMAVIRCLHCHQAALITEHATMHAQLPCLGKLRAPVPQHVQVHQSLVARGRI